MGVSKLLQELIDTTHYTSEGWVGLDSPPKQADGREGWDTAESATDPDDEEEGEGQYFAGTQTKSYVRKESYFARCEHDKLGHCKPEGGGEESPNEPLGKKPTLSSLFKASADTEKEVAQRLGSAVWDALPEGTQTALAGTYKLAKWVEHKAMKGFSGSRKLSSELGRQWGLDDKWAGRLEKTIGFMDLAAAWTVNPIAAGTLTGGNFFAIKGAAWTPIFSLGFIVTSSAINPFKTIAAAKALGKRNKQEHKSMDKESASSVAKALSQVDEAQREWYMALLSAALDDHKGDVSEAIQQADGLFAQHPTEPEGEAMFTYEVPSK